MSRLYKAFLLCRKGRFDVFLYRFLNILGLKNVFLPLPYSLMIEPTNACNLHCPTCPTGSGKMNRPVRMMSLAQFKEIIDQVKPYVIEIILWNYGEPFMNKKLLDMIKYANLAGMYVVTSTNGGFFKSQEFCLEVVKSGLQHLIICLDGTDQETLSQFRGANANFESIVNGFKLISAAKEKLRSRIPIVELQFIVMKHNEHQRSEVGQLAQRLKADSYLEKTVGINFNDPDFQRMARELLPSDLSRSRYGLQEDGVFALKGKIANRCCIVYQTSVVNSDGTVVPCCYDLYSDYMMGNVFEEDFKTIWNNAKYRDFRKQIKNDRNAIPICHGCPEGRYDILKRKKV